MRAPTTLAALLCSGYLAAFAPLPATAGVDACKVVTKSDIEAVLHVNVADGTPFGQQPGSGCNYVRPGDGGVANVVVLPGDPSMYDTAVRRLQSGGQHVWIGPPTPVTGLGQKAVFIRGHGTNLLDVYTKGYLLAINTGSANLDLVRALAQRAIARL